VKILIVDDDPLFRAGLRMLLRTIGNQVSCLEASDLTHALALIAQHADLQLCLLDLMLKDEYDIESIRSIKDAAPALAVVVVSGADDGATIRRSIDAGAMGFIPKSVAPEMLTRALQRVLGSVEHPREQFISRSA
jgi:DNA-binding NarL/FixJ family response regulator